MYIKFRPADINWQSVIATAVIVFIPVLNGTKLNLGFLPKKKRKKKKKRNYTKLTTQSRKTDIQRWDSGGKKEWKQKKFENSQEFKWGKGIKKKNTQMAKVSLFDGRGRGLVHIRMTSIGKKNIE